MKGFRIGPSVTDHPVAFLEEVAALDVRFVGEFHDVALSNSYSGLGLLNEVGFRSRLTMSCNLLFEQGDGGNVLEAVAYGFPPDAGDW